MTNEEKVASSVRVEAEVATIIFFFSFLFSFFFKNLGSKVKMTCSQ